ncbi:MAG: N-acetylmuramoyl-L-alanine amidase-like domain-containing protein [bacterium]
MNKFLTILIIFILTNTVSSCQYQDEKKDTIKKEPIIEIDDSSKIVFDNLIQKARAGKWDTLNLNILISKIGYELLGTPYVSYTLEKQPERCIVNLTKLDCVTYVEAVLGLAKVIKNRNSKFTNLINEVTRIRYRQGELEDYTSRLHYTSDWIYDNVKKGVVQDITKELGGKDFPVNVFFMSKFPKYYKALQVNPEFIPIIAEFEKEINSRKYYFIPKDKIKPIEKKLRTGDIIALTTNISGMDYAHIGFVYVDEEGNRRLLHASSVKKRVHLDRTISEYISRVRKQTGITVLRVVE